MNVLVKSMMASAPTALIIPLLKQDVHMVSVGIMFREQKDFVRAKIGTAETMIR